MGVAIEARGLTKVFRIYDQRFDSLKERILKRWRVPYREFAALRDVDLSVGEGETFAILGRNGSGKSTLLKCIAGILRPSEGVVRVRGRLAAMLELGAGFHPELSGRDNIFLNAAILGFKRKEIEKRFDAIVEFSELADFIDVQVKHYSSGMYARLGFAVAINLEPDVLLIDEVLAVGDEAFQVKCLEKIRSFQREGRTIVLVTHSADVVRSIASRAAVLSAGRVIFEGGASEAVAALREDLMAREQESAHVGPAAFEFVAARVNGHEGTALVESGQIVEVEVAYRARAKGAGEVAIGLEVVKDSGELVLAVDSSEVGFVLPKASEGRFVIRLGRAPLLDGHYFVFMRAVERETGLQLALRERVDSFVVRSGSRARGILDLPVSFEALEVRVEEGSSVAATD
jgi:ABC-2 type transport system ATP-binding protein